MYKISDVVQGSPEWFALRALRMTGSHAQAIAANGKGLMSYIREMMCAYFSFAEQVSYSNKAMEDGIRREAAADMVYEYTTGRRTKVVGFVFRDESVGVSPDRFVGEYGMSEIKCPTDKIYFDYLLDRIVDTKYEWQMQMQMMICQREWCDYVVYNPNFDIDIVIVRIDADHEKWEKLERGLLAGEKEMHRIADAIAGMMRKKVVVVAPQKSKLEIDI